MAPCLPIKSGTETLHDMQLAAEICLLSATIARTYYMVATQITAIDYGRGNLNNDPVINDPMILSLVMLKNALYDRDVRLSVTLVKRQNY